MSAMTKRLSALNDSGEPDQGTSLPKCDDFPNAQEELTHQHLAGLGQAALFLSHEGGNELIVLKTSLALLPQSLDNRVMVNELVEQMRESVNRLRRLFDDIRDFSMPVTVQPVPCDLKQIWRSAWRSLQSAWESRDTIFEEMTDDSDVTLSVDAYRLEQVFRNLFENSLAACDDPVVIGVHCRAYDSALAVTVRDNGSGVKPEQREKIFEIFYTTKSQGSGCGLSIAKRIVEAHGGTIALEHAAPCGTEFVVTLPRNVG